MLGRMCGRYTNTSGPEDIGKSLGISISKDAGTRRFNVAPSQEVLAIVAPEGEPEARLLRWGLIPPWAKELKVGYKMINARSETVASKPSYRSLIPKASRRALQIADGYFEWLKPERRGEPRQPFLFQVDGGITFAFAALWTPAHVGDEWIESVALLTCDSAPNGVAAAIHDRMPVILADHASQQAWLDPALGTDDVLELCHALPAERLTAKPANPALNRVAGTAEGPELLSMPAS